MTCNSPYYAQGLKHTPCQIFVFCDVWCDQWRCSEFPSSRIVLSWFQSWSWVCGQPKVNQRGSSLSQYQGERQNFVKKFSPFQSHLRRHFLIHRLQWRHLSSCAHTFWSLERIHDVKRKIDYVALEVLAKVQSYYRTCPRPCWPPLFYNQHISYD